MNSALETIRQQYNDLILQQFKEQPPVFNDVQQLTQEIKRLTNAINDLKRPAYPAWIQDLIDNAFIKPDGKTAISSLDDIAQEIKNFLRRQINTQHLEMFNKKDGTKFSQKSIKNAVTKANSPD